MLMCDMLTQTTTRNYGQNVQDFLHTLAFHMPISTLINTDIILWLNKWLTHTVYTDNKGFKLSCEVVWDKMQELFLSWRCDCLCGPAPARDVMREKNNNTKTFLLLPFGQSLNDVSEEVWATHFVSDLEVAKLCRETNNRFHSVWLILSDCSDFYFFLINHRPHQPAACLFSHMLD